MKIFIGKIPENPCGRCDNDLKGNLCKDFYDCTEYSIYYGKQLILKQCVEVDFQKFNDWLANKFDEEKGHGWHLESDEFIYLFEQFIKEQVKEKI